MRTGASGSLINKYEPMSAKKDHKFIKKAQLDTGRPASSNKAGASKQPRTPSATKALNNYARISTIQHSDGHSNVGRVPTSASAARRNNNGLFSPKNYSSSQQMN